MFRVFEFLMIDVVTSGARKIAIAYARRVAQWFYYIFLLMFTSSAIKLFIAELYHVPTDSMEQSVLVGDYILVNKLSYGARLPRSPLEIPWFNLLATNDNLFPWFRDTRWGYGRLSDTISISRDDIVVFEGPWDAGTVLVKRCRALPGDMIRLESDRVYVNDILVMEPETVRYSYAFHEVAKNESEETLTNESYYSLHPDTARATQARLGDVVLKLSAYLEDESNDLKTIQVPCKGLTINLNQFRHGLSYYVNIIQRYENAAIEVKDNIILITQI